MGTVIRNNSTSMQLVKLVQFMFRTKLWPVKVDSKGILRHDLFHLAAIIPMGFSVLAAGIVLYLTIPLLLEQDMSKMSQKIEACMFFLSIVGPQGMVFGIQASICCMDISVCNSAAKLDRKLLVYVSMAAGILISFFV